jgi:hypothetical protein
MATIRIKNPLDRYGAQYFDSTKRGKNSPTMHLTIHSAIHAVVYSLRRIGPMGLTWP